MTEPSQDPRLLLSLARDHRWLRIRLTGWAFIAAWQVLGLVSEFLPLDLDAKAVRIAGRVIGLVGLAMVVWGFERLVQEAHRRLGEAH